MLKYFRKTQGFTLIELLIVVAIIGILAAIAIPQFAAYRIRGFNSAAHSDGKNLVTAQEATFVDTASYAAIALTNGPATVVQGTTSGGATVNLPAAKLSNNVQARASILASTGGVFFTLGTANVQGDRIFGFESEEGAWAWVGKTAGTQWAGTEAAACASTSDFADTNRL